MPGADGIYASAMERYFQEHEFRTFSFRGDWEMLKQHLQKGRPLIAALAPSGPNAELHYVVVVGLDTDRDLILLNDPARRKLLKQDRSDFEKQWGVTGNWTLTVTDPNNPDVVLHEFAGTYAVSKQEQ